MKRLTRLVVNHAKATVVLSVLFIVGFGLAAGNVFGPLKTEGFADTNANSAKAERTLTANFGNQTNLVLLVRPKAGDLQNEAVDRAGVALTSRLQADPNLSNVQSYWQNHAPALRARDNSSAIIALHVKGNEAEAQENATKLINDVKKSDSAIVVDAGGYLGIGKDISTAVGKGLGLSESIAIPLTLLLLVVAFGALIAALLPLGIGSVAIIGAFAALFGISQFADVSLYSLNLVTAFGLGLGIDYALLIVNRYREETHNGLGIDDAIVATMGSAGRAIIFSAATVTVALVGLQLFPGYFLRSMGYGVPPIDRTPDNQA